jgi:hypothetical protein
LCLSFPPLGGLSLGSADILTLTFSRDTERALSQENVERARAEGRSGQLANWGQARRLHDDFWAKRGGSPRPA